MTQRQSRPILVSGRMLSVLHSTNETDSRAGHCVGMLRQNIMCNAEVGVIGSPVGQRRAYIFSRFQHLA
jgi:hypothetical protein